MFITISVMLVIVGLLTVILVDDRDVMRTRLGTAGVLLGCGLVVLGWQYQYKAPWLDDLGVPIWFVSLLLLIPRWTRLVVLGLVTGFFGFYVSTMGV